MGFGLFFSTCALLWLLVAWQLGGCLDEERRALLEIKSAFNFTNYSPDYSWENGSDCCTWKGVRCDSGTGRVIVLDLGYATIEERLEELYLNASLFLPFQELRNLNLSWNFIVGCIPNEGFERLSKLRKLEVLDISNSNFNLSTVLPSLVELSSLKYLYLSWNNMDEGSFPVSGLKRLSKLTKLELLDLRSSAIDESIVPFLLSCPSLKTLLLSINKIGGSSLIQDLTMLSSLEVLDLSSNELNGSVPSSVGAWTSLKALSLTGNKFSGILPMEGLCNLKKLQELDLSWNEFTGVVPSCLGNLTSLRFFDISANQFQMKFPSSLFLNLTSLEYLSLGNNSLEGTLSFSSLSNHSKLQKFILVGKNNALDVETEHPPWIPTFQLDYLALSNCNLNKASGAIPSFLSNQYALRVLDLSHNRLDGNIPSWLLENKTRLEYLMLTNNSLTGPLNLPYMPPNSLTSISYLDISKNRLQGEIPKNMDVLLPNLQFLNMSRNAFQGSIPLSLTNMTNMFTLDLSNNNLSGQIPKEAASGWSGVQFLDLSNNILQGRMLELADQSPMWYLKLSDNFFTGEIPNSLCSGGNSLLYLRISNNKLSGSLPNCIGNLSGLKILQGDVNGFEGPIPTELCELQQLESLDLSENKLSGRIPSCFNATRLKSLHLHSNALRGSIPSALSRSTNILTLDLRDNHLSGSLPGWIGRALTQLRILVLNNNHFDGPIPINVCQLNHLRILDLSHNKLSGTIPSCLNEITHSGQNEFQEYETDVGFGMNPPLYFKSLLGIAYWFDSYKGEGQTGLTEEEVEVTTKNRYDPFKGDVLNYMSGMDLSGNQLVGDIPPELGDLSWLHALNLSNNALGGTIPATLSNLEGIESLDLSHNRLVGRIPHELVALHFLAAFSVAYNNLYGPTPGMDAQLITFGESSYAGNPGLCGPPLKNNCTLLSPTFPVQVQGNKDDGDEAADRLILFASIAVSFIMGFWGSMAVLYCKTNWRYRLFGTVDAYSDSFYLAISKVLAKAKARR